METNLTFLVVDDDFDDTDFFCEAVREIDPSHTCIAVHDCGEALVKLRNGGDTLPDFIFLDLNMPGMDGRTCLRELKQDASLSKIPVVIYTTSSQQTDRDETFRIGAAHFLTKANSFRKMVEGISNAVETVGSEKRRL